MSGGPRPEQKRRRSRPDPLADLEREFGVSEADPLTQMAREFGVDDEPEAPRERILPALNRVEWPDESREERAVASHRARYGSAPASVVTDSEDGAQVVVGRPRSIGTPKAEVDRVVGDPSLATRVTTRLLHLPKQPAGYRHYPKQDAPGAAATLANIALSNVISPFSDEAADRATERALEDYGRGGRDVGKLAIPAAIAAAGGATGANIALSAVPLAPTIPGQVATKALRTVGTRALQGATENAAAGAVGAGLIEDRDAGEVWRRSLEQGAWGLLLGGGFAALPNAAHLSREVRDLVIPAGASRMEIQTHILPRLPERDRRVVERDLGIYREEVPSAGQDDAFGPTRPTLDAASRARAQTALAGGVAEMEIRLKDDPLAAMEKELGLASEPPSDAGTTLGPVSDLVSRPPRGGEKVEDEDGIARFKDPRASSGGRRKVGSVSTEGLIRELLELEAKQMRAERRSIYNHVPDENFHSTEDGRNVFVATRIGGKGPSEQSKAMRNIEDFANIRAQVTEELARRGLDTDAVADRMEQLRVERAEREGMETEIRPRGVPDEKVRDEAGNVLFDPQGDLDVSTFRAPRDSGVLLSPMGKEPPKGAGITLDAPERLEVFALRADDDTIVEGTSGMDAWRRAREAGIHVDMSPGSLMEGTWKNPSGFVTSTGRFVQGREALMIAFRAGQLRKNSRAYRELSEGIVPLRVPSPESNVRGVGGKKGREPRSVAGPIAGEIQRVEYVPKVDGEAPPHILHRALKAAPTDDNPTGVWRIHSFSEEGWQDPKTGTRQLVQEGYYLSDGSFITRAEAAERFGPQRVDIGSTEGADIGWEGRDPETGGALFDPEPESSRRRQLHGDRQAAPVIRHASGTERLDHDAPEHIIAAAVKARDGRVFVGQTHFFAVEASNGHIPKMGGPQDVGFVTNKGRFLGRQAAEEELDSLAPDSVRANLDAERQRGGSGLDATDFGKFQQLRVQGELIAPRQDERIVAAAVRSSDRRVFRAATHGEAINEAEHVLGRQEAWPEESQGFVTSSGRFVSREEAYRIAEQMEESDPFSVSLDQSDAGSLDAGSLRGGRMRMPSGEARLSPDREAGDLFGSQGSEAKQESLFGSQEGTARGRNLSQAEAAARAELDRLGEELKLATAPNDRVRLSSRIAELQKLVNRDRKISADELANQAASSADTDLLDDPSQGTLLAPSGSGRRGGVQQKSIPSPPAQTPRARLVAAIQAFGQKVGRKGATEDVMYLRKISTGLADAVGVPLYQGRGNLKRMSARGAFWVKPEVIRVNRLGNVATVMHESLHYLDKTLGIRAIVKATADPAVRKQASAELVQLGKDLYGNRRPQGGYASEGVAEFGKFYVTDPSHLQRRAPVATKLLTEILAKHPELKGALDKAQADFARFEAAPAEAKIQAMIEDGVPSRFNVSGREAVRLMFDDLEPIKHAVDQLGKPNNIIEDAYALARLTKGNAGRSQDMIERGVIEFGSSGKRVTRGIPQILEEIGEHDFSPFVRYWVAEQVLTKEGQGISTGFDVKAASDLVVKGRQNPKYAKAAKELWEFRSALLQYMEDAGLPVNAAAIRKNNPTPTPFYRHFEPDEIRGGAGKEMARSKAPVYQLVGSDRPILPPLESLVSDAYRMIDVAHRHHAAQTLVKQALATEGGGKVASLLPEVPMEVQRVTMTQAHQQLVDAGWLPPPATKEGQPGPDPLDALLGFYQKKRAGLSEAQDQVMPVSIDGQLRWVQIHDGKLYDALQAMKVQELDMWGRILSAPTRLLRMGATQRNPDFMLVNPVRDAFQAAVYSRGPTHLPGYHITRGLFHWVRGRFGDGDEIFERWTQEGGESASLVGADRRLLKQAYDKTVADLTAHGWRRVGRHITHPLRLASALFEAMENATRLGESAVVREQGLKAGLPEREASTRGAMAAREVTLDFFKSGESTRFANRFVAFLTAHLNDVEKMAKEFNPVQLLDTPEARKRYLLVNARAAAFITVPSVTLYLLQKDDPVYQEIPEYWKATSWVIVDNEDGPFAYTTPSGKRIRAWVIPRPHLLGYAFGYVPEKAMEWINQNDPEALKDAARQAWASVLPLSMVIPTLAVPLVENYANKSIFSGRSIVPESAEGLVPAEQASRRTGEVARTVGAAVNYSPAKLENVLRGYTGGLGMLAKDIADAGLRAGRDAVGVAPLSSGPLPDEDRLDRIPVVRRFLIPTPGGDAKSVTRLIEDFEAADQLRRTWLSLRKRDPQRAAAYLEEHRAAITSVATGEEAGGTPGSLRARYVELMRLKRANRDVQERVPDWLVRAATQRANEARQVQQGRAYIQSKP
jgi:hypothetical protein